MGSEDYVKTVKPLITSLHSSMQSQFIFTLSPKYLGVLKVTAFEVHDAMQKRAFSSFSFVLRTGYQCGLKGGRSHKVVMLMVRS